MEVLVTVPVNTGGLVAVAASAGAAAATFMTLLVFVCQRRWNRRTAPRAVYDLAEVGQPKTTDVTIGVQ